MNTITGHLTQTEKRHIRAILDQGLQSGKIGKKTYFISQERDVYTVKIHQTDRGLIPSPGSHLRTTVYTATFEIK